MRDVLELFAPVAGIAALILVVQFLWLRWEAQRLTREVPPEIAGDAEREEAYRVALEIQRRRTLATMRRVTAIAIVLLGLLVLVVWLSGRGG